MKRVNSRNTDGHARRGECLLSAPQDRLTDQALRSSITVMSGGAPTRIGGSEAPTPRET